MKSPVRSSLIYRLIGVFIIVSILFAGANPSRVTQAAPFRPLEKAELVQSADGWVTLMAEDFEGVFPSAGWHIGREGAPYLWGKSTCHPHSGSYSIGSHTGGSMGSQLTCEDEYPLNYVTTLSYGPFDLTGCTDMRLNFSHLTKLDLIDDYLSVGYSINGGASWSVLTWGGDRTISCDGWCEWTLYEESYPIPLCGQPRVYLLFRFQSDWTDGGFGSWVDDVSLEALYGSLLRDKTAFLPTIFR